MPTYQYACTECGHNLEAVQSFSDDPLTVCPECQGRLRKVFSAVGVVFKGSGFYRTDSRASSNGSSKGSSSDNGASNGAPKSANGSEAKSGSNGSGSTSESSSASKTSKAAASS